jgi:WD40 repeat protein
MSDMSDITNNLSLYYSSMPRGRAKNLICNYAGHSSWVSTLDWSPDSTLIVSGSGDSTAQIWDAHTGEHLLTYHGHQAGVNAVSWSPDGRSIVSGGNEHRVYVWDAHSGETQVIYEGHHAWIRRGLAWSPDSQSIASGSWDRTVHLWDARTGETQRIYQGHTGIVYAVLWSSDGSSIVSGAGNGDASIQRWSVETGETIWKHVPDDTEYASVHSLSWSPDGSQLAVAGLQYYTCVLDAHTGDEHLHINEMLPLVDWSPDGELLALEQSNGGVMVVRASTGEKVMTYYTDGLSRVKALRWSPDGNMLAAVGMDNAVKVFCKQ